MNVAKRYDLAETFFRRAIAIDPQPAAEWQGLGEALSRERKYDEALDAFKNTVQRSPKSVSAYMHVGQLIRDLRDEWDDAEQAYGKVLEIEPENALAKNNLAWDYAEHGGNIDIALRLAQEATQANAGGS